MHVYEKKGVRPIKRIIAKTLIIVATSLSQQSAGHNWPSKQTNKEHEKTKETAG
jgi:hypothetical protein